MPPSELVQVIRQVHGGKKRVPPEVVSHLAEHMSDEALTPREIEVLRQIAGGNRNRDIGDHLAQIYEKSPVLKHRSHHLLIM